VRSVIKALIFDFGGVLTNPVWESFAHFCREEGLEEDTIKELFRSDPGALADLRELEKGTVSEPEFERRFAERLGLESSEGLIERLFVGMTPLEEMIEVVRLARAAGLKTALLSNSWSVDHYDREMLDALFDVAIISGEVGMHKPQEEIYRLTVEKLGVEPSECVFIDDLRENCEAAEAIGMTAIRHRHHVETIPKLESLTALQLS
jgi:epoxide hydrolase-like predicted phosphatase